MNNCLVKYSYIHEVLEFPGDSVVKTWYFNTMCSDLSLVKEVISHKASGKEKVT